MLLAMAVMVFNVVALVVEGLQRVMFNLPARSSTAHEAIHVAFAHAHVRDPTARLDCVSAHLPGRDDMNPHLRVRCIEGHVIDQATPLDKTRAVVVPRSLAHASGVRCGLPPREQIGVSTFFAPENITPIMGLEGLYGWRIRTQTVVGDQQRAVGMVLPPGGHHACGGMAVTSIFVRAILLDDRFRPQRHHFTPVWMDNRRAQQLMRIGDRTVAVHLVPTRRPVKRRGGNIPCAIEGPSIVPIQARHGFKRLASLAVSKDAREHGL
jgi:hypothetical protein